LAWGSTDNNINWSDIGSLYLGEVPEIRNVGETLFEQRATERVDLCEGGRHPRLGVAAVDPWGQVEIVPRSGRGFDPRTHGQISHLDSPHVVGGDV
jgi:hypothetical protein